MGPLLIPAGTEVEGEPPAHNHMILPTPLPINAVAMDDAAALKMCEWYEESASIAGWHHLVFHPSIDRHAVFATARHQKRGRTGRRPSW